MSNNSVNFEFILILVRQLCVQQCPCYSDLFWSKLMHVLSGLLQFDVRVNLLARPTLACCVGWQYFGIRLNCSVLIGFRIQCGCSVSLELSYIQFAWQRRHLSMRLNVVNCSRQFNSVGLLHIGLWNKLLIGLKPFCHLIEVYELFKSFERYLLKHLQYNVIIVC